MRIRPALFFVLACTTVSCTSLKNDPGSTRLQEARARFALRCASSGEFIRRTVDNVDEIFLMKIRPAKINYGDQFVLDDPYGSDLGGHAYIESFLRETYDVKIMGIPSFPSRRRQKMPRGFLYVEADNAEDGRRYRYAGHIEQPGLTNEHYLKNYFRFVLDKELSVRAKPRYGVTYEDISTREDRELWIAGSSLKVIDLESGEVIGERIGYMMDVGQGSTGSGGGRSPWLLATRTACPRFAGPGSSSQTNQTIKFVEKVIHAKKL